MIIEILLIILYHILSLKDIGRLSDTINTIRASGNTEYHGLYSMKKLRNLRNIIDQMDSASDVNTVLKTSGVEKDFAQKALKRSVFSDDATTTLKGLKNSGDSLTSLENIFTGIGTTLKVTLTNPLTWIAGAGIAAVGALIYKATEFDRAVNAPVLF